jgi:DNA excision repair protein ERCC-4
MDLPRRLALLVLHFPSQAILWSSSPDASAEMIQDLQSKEENPILEIAQSIGSDMVEKEGSFNLTVGEMLLDIPGINYKNWKIVMTKSKSLKGLANMNLVELQDMIGVENGRLVYQFFNSAF